MKVRLQREPTTDQGTFGKLTIGGDSFFTAEPPWRNNASNRSCIPDGKYTMLPHISPRFGKCLLIVDTKPRTVVLIHSGNLAGDTAKGYKTHSHGCLLPGTRQGKLTVNNKRQRAVLCSKTAMRRILNRITKPTPMVIKND